MIFRKSKPAETDADLREKYEGLLSSAEDAMAAWAKVPKDAMPMQLRTAMILLGIQVKALKPEATA